MRHSTAESDVICEINAWNSLAMETITKHKCPTKNKARNFCDSSFISPKEPLSSASSRKEECYFKKAVSCLQHALKISTSSKCIEGLVTTHINLCNVYSQCGHHERALKYAQMAAFQAQNDLLSLANKEATANSDGNSPLNYLKRYPKKLYSLSISYYNLAVELEYTGHQCHCLSWYSKAMSLFKKIDFEGNSGCYDLFCQADVAFKRASRLYSKTSTNVTPNQTLLYKSGNSENFSRVRSTNTAILKDSDDSLSRDTELPLCLNKYVSESDTMLNKKLATTKIQAVLRGNHARNIFRHMKKNLQCQLCVTRVQALWRGKYARNLMMLTKLENERHTQREMNIDSIKTALRVLWLEFSRLLVVEIQKRIKSASLIDEFLTVVNDALCIAVAIPSSFYNTEKVCISEISCPENKIISLNIDSWQVNVTAVLCCVREVDKECQFFLDTTVKAAISLMEAFANVQEHIPGCMDAVECKQNIVDAVHLITEDIIQITLSISKNDTFHIAFSAWKHLLNDIVGIDSLEMLKSCMPSEEDFSSDLSMSLAIKHHMQKLIEQQKSINFLPDDILMARLYSIVLMKKIEKGLSNAALTSMIGAIYVKIYQSADDCISHVGKGVYRTITCLVESVFKIISSLFHDETSIKEDAIEAAVLIQSQMRIFLARKNVARMIMSASPQKICRSNEAECFEQEMINMSSSTNSRSFKKIVGVYSECDICSESFQGNNPTFPRKSIYRDCIDQASSSTDSNFVEKQEPLCIDTPMSSILLKFCVVDDDMEAIVAAVMFIQRCYRHHRARLAYEQSLVQHYAAVLLQAFLRGCFLRNRFKEDCK